MLSINPFKRRQRMQEYPESRQEQYLPPDLERFRVQPQETSSFEPPERERKFQAFAREMKPPENIGWSMENPIERNPAERNMQESGLSQNKQTDDDRLDMVLQKLETIDLRLKLIEQKLERRPI